MALSYFFNNQNISGLRVWTSWLKRTIQTAAQIDAPQERWRALNEIDAGCMEHLTYEDIEEKYPEEYAAREVSKLTYRYPSGESYQVRPGPGGALAALQTNYYPTQDKHRDSGILYNLVLRNLENSLLTLRLLLISEPARFQVHCSLTHLVTLRTWWRGWSR